MIEVAAANIDSTQRLFEALENSRLPAGEGKVSDTRGPVPREVAEEFRVLMQGPENPQGLESTALQGSQATGAIEQNFSPTQSDLSADKVEQVSGLTPEQNVEFLTPEALLQQQFSVSMTVFESKYFSQMQSQATSNLEQRLKSQEG